MFKDASRISFFDVGRDSVAALRDGDLHPRYEDAAWLGAVVATNNQQQRLGLYKFIRNYRDEKRARKCVVFRSFPIIVENFRYVGKVPMVNDRILLAGASALRVRMKLAKNLPGEEVDRRIMAETVSRHAANDAAATSEMAEIDHALPFVIECRNFFNFYHFTTESLIYFQMYRDYGLTGEIHLISSSDEIKGFIGRLISDLYPDLVERVKYVSGRVTFKRAIIPFNTNHLYHQATPEVIEDIETKARFNKLEQDGALRPPSIANYKRIYNNSRDEYIDRHRLNALAHSTPKQPGARLYVSRRPGAGKDRELKGEDRLEEMLSRHDFKKIYLEDLSPREQIDLCRDADIFLSAHGAGFANMMYARPGAWFIELSHLQTARHRFGDFNMHAAVSGARYLHFFADHATNGADGTPKMEEAGHAGIHLTKFALDRLEGLVSIITDVHAYKGTLMHIKNALRESRPDIVKSFVEKCPAYLKGCAEICLVAAEACMMQNKPEKAMRHLSRGIDIAPFRADLWDRYLEISQATSSDGAAAPEVGMRHAFRNFRWMRSAQDVSGATLIQAPEGYRK